MSIEKFIAYLKTIENIEEHDIIRIRKSFKYKICKKKEILISNNQICDKVFFITKGILRAYSIDEKGIEKTRVISVENEFCGNWASFHNLSTNNEFIQSLELSEVVYVDHKDFYQLVNSSQALNKIYTKILEKFQVYHVKRFEFISNLSLQERLQKIDLYFPNLQNRISNKVLASFLHATPEHCSSAKKKVVKLLTAMIAFINQDLIMEMLTLF
ncbi:Crp/Fnr family transcriptional regulator [Chryseobacterium sp. SL1]|jgi:CRP-like cAMP-binding protein|uniref:Crp/Fnr family transcriptional regulator n=1 Tax=Chryseobacterium sp. SL1 TaxID=2995159 RepID=UPI002276E48E|nr:Crp/Fnr family transcriptional regulator [Chryseobacterium sp. SL1]MCY1661150.1 Crp/Fnr family transcriptional regulator [Chryseobacterium sp. SL1]